MLSHHSYPSVYSYLARSECTARSSDNLKVILPRITLISIDAHKLRLKYEHAICRYWPHTSAAVTPFRLDGQLPPFSNAHIEQSLIPAFNHLTFAYMEGERRAAVVGRVELGAWNDPLVPRSLVEMSRGSLAVFL